MILGNQNKVMPKNPERKDFNGGNCITMATINATTAMVHHGKKNSVSEDRKAMSMVEMSSFINVLWVYYDCVFYFVVALGRVIGQEH